MYEIDSFARVQGKKADSETVSPPLSLSSLSAFLRSIEGLANKMLHLSLL